MKWNRHGTLPHLTLALLWAVLLSGCETVKNGDEATADKPAAPLVVTLEAMEEATPGQIVTFRATVRPLIDAEQIELHIVLPEGISPFGGAFDWQGSLAKAASRSIEFQIRVPEAGRHTLRANAVIPHQSGRFAAQATLIIGPEEENPAGIMRRERSRDGVIEYEVR